MQVGAERFVAPECLFTPALLGGEQPGIAQMVWSVVQVCAQSKGGHLALYFARIRRILRDPLDVFYEDTHFIKIPIRRILLRHPFYKIPFRRIVLRYPFY